MISMLYSFLFFREKGGLEHIDQEGTCFLDRQDVFHLRATTYKNKSKEKKYFFT